MSDEKQQSDAGGAAAANPGTNPVLIVAVVAFVLLGSGLFYFMGRDEPPVTKEPPGQETLSGCLANVLNESSEVKRDKSGELGGELEALAKNNLKLADAKYVKTLRDNDKEVLKLAIQTCGARFNVGNATFEFSVEVLRNGKLQGGVTVFHNVQGGRECQTNPSGACQLTIVAGLLDDVTLRARVDSGGYFGEKKFAPEELKSLTPVAIPLQSTGSRTLTVEIINLNRDGEVALRLSPTPGDVELLNQQCTQAGSLPSDACSRAQTLQKRATFSYSGELEGLEVEASFGGKSETRDFSDFGAGHSLLKFDWKPSAPAGASAAKRCTTVKTEKALRAAVKNMRWETGGTVSATVHADRSLTDVSAPGNKAAIKRLRLPVESANCQSSLVEVEAKASRR